MAKTVWITGSSRGIGKGIALKFAENGHRVVLHCRNRIDELDAFCCQLKGKGCSVMKVVGDVSRESDVKRMAGEICDCFGPVEILINNAGIALQEKLLTECSEQEISSILDVNIKGSLLCSREVIPEMVSVKQGSIVNISSYFGVVGGSCEVPYSASKAAVIGMTKSLAKELAPSGIRVNCVAPGYVQTEMNAEFDAEAREWIRSEIPMGRFTTAEDIANMVYFFALEETAQNITGQIACVDGGSSL